jgi:hypothetical protein
VRAADPPARRRGKNYADRAGGVDAINGVKRNAPAAEVETVPAERAD